MMPRDLTGRDLETTASPHPAALVLHGFSGDPWEVAPLAAGLTAAGFRVEAPRLPGHDGRPESLEASTWQAWADAAREAFGRLAASGGPVCIAGQSMGALLALHLAAEQRRRVTALALLSTPLRLVGRARLYGWLVRRFGVRERWRFVAKGPRDALDQTAVAGSPQTPLIPARAFLEFDRLRRIVRHELGKIDRPALVIHAARDHTAWPGSADLLRRRLAGPVECLRLARSYHQVLVDVEGPEVVRAVIAFFRRHAGLPA